LAGRTWYRFRLYVADDTENSAQALANLTSLCQQHLSGCHEVEVVDVFRHPERARIDHIRMTPTLLKLEPAPVLRIIGTLGDTQQVLRALGLGYIAV
jgi:circadian clock protein KaiB